MVPLPSKKHRASGPPSTEIEVPHGTFAVILPPEDVAGTIMEVLLLATSLNLLAPVFLSSISFERISPFA